LLDLVGDPGLAGCGDVRGLVRRMCGAGLVYKLYRGGDKSWRICITPLGLAAYVLRRDVLLRGEALDTPRWVRTLESTSPVVEEELERFEGYWRMAWGLADRRRGLSGEDKCVDPRTPRPRRKPGRGGYTKVYCVPEG